MTVPSCRPALLVFVVTFFAVTGSLAARMPTRVVDETPREYYQFLFLYEQTSAPGQFEFIVHPFYGQYENEERAYFYRHFLYPVFLYHGTDQWRRWSFLYVFTGEEFYHEDTEEDTDLFLSPFFNLGLGDSENDRYFSVFPIYGNLQNKLGWSELTFALWPLYTSWSHRDYRAYSILWPIVMWGGSATRSDFRILPLYSKKEHYGKYVRRTVLWPLFQWGSEGLDKREPRHFFFSFPLYGQKWSDDGNLSAHTILWLPVLGSLAAWGSDERRNSFNLNLLFFIYQYNYNEDPDTYKHIIFPFYGYYRFGSPADKPQEGDFGRDTYPGYDTTESVPYYREMTFITPFYVNLVTHSTVVESDYDVLVPFYWNMDRYYRSTRVTESYLKLWPLFYHIEDSSGRTEFKSLTLWPFRSDQFERVWGTFWSLLEYNHYQNDDRYFSMLLRLFSVYWNDLESHYFVLGFDYRNTPDYWSVSFLGGFLGYRRDYAIDAGMHSIPGKNTLQLLWLDI